MFRMQTRNATQRRGTNIGMENKRRNVGPDRRTEVEEKGRNKVPEEPKVRLVGARKDRRRLEISRLGQLFPTPPTLNRKSVFHCLGFFSRSFVPARKVNSSNCGWKSSTAGKFGANFCGKYFQQIVFGLKKFKAKMALNFFNQDGPCR